MKTKINLNKKNLITSLAVLISSIVMRIKAKKENNKSCNILYDLCIGTSLYKLYKEFDAYFKPDPDDTESSDNQSELEKMSRYEEEILEDD